MSRELYKEIVDLLVELKEGDLGELCKRKNVSISSAMHCKASYDAFMLWYNTSDDVYDNWDKFSGDYMYPVPSPDENMTPEEYYYYTPNKWGGEYGKLRMDLLDRMIEWYSRLADEEDEHD